MNGKNISIKRELATSIIIGLISLLIAFLLQMDQVIKYKKEVVKLEKQEMVLTESGCYQVIIENRKVSFKKK